jgi:hypothetical protein
VLFTALFDEKLRVPEEYIAATVGLRKKCRSLKGAAGTKRKRLIAEYAAAKKKVKSKINFMRVQRYNAIRVARSQRDLSFQRQIFPPHQKARRRYPP